MRSFHSSAEFNAFNTGFLHGIRTADSKAVPPPYLTDAELVNAWSEGFKEGKEMHDTYFPPTHSTPDHMIA